MLFSKSYCYTEEWLLSLPKYEASWVQLTKAIEILRTSAYSATIPQDDNVVEKKLKRKEFGSI